MPTPIERVIKSLDETALEQRPDVEFLMRPYVPGELASVPIADGEYYAVQICRNPNGGEYIRNFVRRADMPHEWLFSPDEVKAQLRTVMNAAVRLNGSN